MGKKTTDDREIEERVRAHVRRRMEELNIGVTKAADLCGCNQGNLSKILLDQRGLGLGMTVRLIAGLGLDALRTMTIDPDRRYYQPYVPRPRDEDPRTPSPRTFRR